jgi:hypothetical protein
VISPDLADGRSTSARLRDVEAERDRLRAFVLMIAVLDVDGWPPFSGHVITRDDLAAAAREVLA